MAQQFAPLRLLPSNRQAGPKPVGKKLWASLEKSMKTVIEAGFAEACRRDPEHQADLISFDQREQRVVELGDDLKNWLLQQHVAADPCVAAPPGQAVACPHCGKPARLEQRPDRPLLERRLTTRCGEVALKRQKWRCTRCRVAFFPSGPPAAPGH